MAKTGKASTEINRATENTVRVNMVTITELMEFEDITGERERRCRTVYIYRQTVQVIWELQEL